ncbi:MAG TPA: BatA and WFA domain-containing protein [Planctomycetaceae bacterium]|nr:BatA and WFA domain-containing protein [Planctomycetaceae bacterium]
MSSPLLAFIELTTPAMLGGLALLSLPIVAHLLNRRARQAIVFPTIQLLRASVATQSWLYRLRRLILLCLRCLAVAMLVLAFCRPVWLDTRTKNAGSDKGAAVVLLMDTSASTAQRADEVSVLGELRATGIRTLDSLRVGIDVADIVLASARPHALFPSLSANVPALREELTHLEPTFERADLLQAVALSGQLLAAHVGQRQLVVLSDLQRSNWQEVVQGHRAATLLPSDTQLTLIDVRTAAPDNVGLSSPRHFPAQPLVGQPIRLVVQVANFAKVAKEVRLSVSLDGHPLPPQTVDLAASEERDVTVETVLKGPGEHQAVFEIPADGLAADNRAFLVVEAQRRLPVVVVSDDDPNEAGTASYFLTRALAPRNDPKLDRFEVRHVASSQLTDDKLAGAAVFVGYLGELTPQAAGTLLKFLQAGGGIVYFCGEGAVPRNLKLLEQTAGKEGLLPWEPGLTRAKAAPDHALTITNGKWRSRLLREFDEQSQIAISQIRFNRVWSAGPLSPDATVLLNFSDGTPALGLRLVGTGEFLLANFSPALESSDLGKYGSFVALVQNLAQQLGQGASSKEAPAIVGESYRTRQTFRIPPGAGRLAVLNPKNEQAAFATSGDADHVAIELQQTTLPGFYRFQLGDQTVATAALNVDPRESNLERIDRESLLHCFDMKATRPALEGAAGWEPLANLRGRPLWGWCLATTMAAFGIELFLLGYWKR